MSSQNIHLYLTSAHDCGYLPGRIATNLVPDPRLKMDMSMYSQLITLGYRRSGQFTYRPHCNDCDACTPCRIPVSEFKPNRNQRRCVKHNAELVLNISNAHFSDEHFSLYTRYINARHADGDMVNPSPQDYRNFLYSEWSDTWFLEARLDDTLVAVAVFDRVADGLSAVYSFFEPTLESRSLGTFNILNLLEHTEHLNLPYLYMGYLINDCDKMQYKKTFHPLQCFVDNRWHTQHVSS
jgi:arginine-tRNA-protein transferase